MRQVRFTPEAARTLAEQLDYLIGRGALLPAQALKARVEGFVSTTLANYPRNGRYVPQRDLWETWIPRTRLIVWYTFNDDTLVLLAFWHTSQNRAGG